MFLVSKFQVWFLMSQAALMVLIPPKLPFPSFKLRGLHFLQGGFPVPPFTSLFRPFLLPRMALFFLPLLALPGSVDGSPSPPHYFKYFWDCSSPEGGRVHLPPHPNLLWAFSLCCCAPTVSSFCEYSVFQIGLWVLWGVGDTLSLERK